MLNILLYGLEQVIYPLLNLCVKYPYLGNKNLTDFCHWDLGWINLLLYLKGS